MRCPHITRSWTWTSLYINSSKPWTRSTGSGFACFSGAFSDIIASARPRFLDDIKSASKRLSASTMWKKNVTDCRTCLPTVAPRPVLLISVRYSNSKCSVILNKDLVPFLYSQACSCQRRFTRFVRVEVALFEKTLVKIACSLASSQNPLACSVRDLPSWDISISQSTMSLNLRSAPCLTTSSVLMSLAKWMRSFT